MSSQQSTNSHVGPKTTGGKAGAVPTPANAHIGTDKLETKPKAFDSEGAIGKQFTGMFSFSSLSIRSSHRIFPPHPPPLHMYSAQQLTQSPPQTETGAIGQIGEAVGGPLSSGGVIGKQFTDQGAIGGSIQEALGGSKQSGPGIFKSN
ncbi:hypothetical protein B0H65DRAFT_475562 [Neurospora tetraspora]|uniref:Uncharacterized protein n=1 Tax=Neurospora tetraspora TaxID=94610 RepID=A0AAE0J8X5_9PEZI|nr:hypothetical protein B0H65DRAFT_475562 [Neurospora tetraspora]